MSYTARQGFIYLTKGKLFMSIKQNSIFEITDEMNLFVDHFGKLGPRWGLNNQTCRLNALLYLLGKPLDLSQICSYLNVDTNDGNKAIEDLSQWGMLQRSDNTTYFVKGEPWDLLFTALKERQKRELEPALDMLNICLSNTDRENQLPLGIKQRIQKMHTLVTDLKSISDHTNIFSSGVLKNMVGIGGKTARFFDRHSANKGD